MAIVRNERCPACTETGHDSKGDHLMVFEDGGKFCNRSHYHKNGMNYYLPPDADDPILDMNINGSIKYTVDQFNQLLDEGKLVDPSVRYIALSGMRGQDRWKVSTDEEKQELLDAQKIDEKYYEGLKVRNLIDRHISGRIAKFYGVKVGLDSKGDTARHYYPIYAMQNGSIKWKGAKCRTLPKDFRYDHLGFMWGDNMLFGQNKTADILKEGGRYDTLLLVGGECDAMAAQQMLYESRKGTRWEKVHYHVWSVTKGEQALEEILYNKESIKKFKKVIVCFDNDPVGNKLNMEVAKLFRGITHKLVIPSGCKDPNDVLKQGRGKEFVDAWFNPVNPFESGVLSPVSKFKKKAKEMPTMGKGWPWPSLDRVTFGIRDNYLCVLGAGTGVGKTKITKDVVHHITTVHREPVVVIYLEEPAMKTVRSFAGALINKDLTAPPINDPSDPDYDEETDYTEAEADAAIDKLSEDNMIIIGDLDGRKDVDSVMEVLQEAISLGYKRFIIDNLTAFKHTGENGKNANKVDAIDETMKQLGTFKDENPVWILLLSHLNRPYGDRKAHEEGGRVTVKDFRGSGSIGFWANDIFGAERNTQAEDIEEKCTTTLRNLKSRDNGKKTGFCVYMKMNRNTGMLVEVDSCGINKDFDDGTKPKQQEEERDF